MGKLKGVSLRELEAWLKKNQHIAEKDHKLPGAGRGLFLEFDFDTAQMKVTKIVLLKHRFNSKDSITITLNDGDLGSILDELERRLTEDLK